MQEYDLDSVDFVEPAFFVATPTKIQTFTQFVLKHFHQTRTLANSLRNTSEENKETIYKQAALLDQQFRRHLEKEAGFAVLAHLMSKNHPDAPKLSKVVMKVFEQQQFLKHTANGNLKLRPINRINAF